jgi:uncharacterized protein (TIGR02246 family)
MLAACAAETGEQEAAVASEMTTAADEAALEQLRADYVTHYNMHHASVVADMFTDSAFALWADGSVAEGKPELLASLEADMAGTPTLDLTTGDIMVLGDNAVARGGYSVNVTPAGAAAMTLAGNYMTYFQRVDGAWKISGVISNYSAPPPPGLPTPPEEEPPPDNGTMADLAAAYTQAFNAGDAAALAALYTEDAVVSFTDSPFTEGRAAIQTALGANITPGATIEIHDVGTMDLGDGWSLDGGWYRVNATAETGKVQQEGIYMSLVRRAEDGSWKIHWGVVNGQTTPAT